jgi:hypothetical protein
MFIILIYTKKLNHFTMKFLKRRDNYLRTLNERKEIQINQRIEEIGYKLISENQAGSGIMGNEIKWGDCLLGRFIHSIIRKSQVGANLMRMKPVIARLRSAMDELLLGGGFSDFDERDKALFNLALASEYLDVLKVAIQNYGTPDATEEFDTLEEIKGLVNDTISKLEGTTSTPYLGSGFENKNEIIRQLKKLSTHLGTLKEPKEEESQADDEDSQDSVDSDDTREKSKIEVQINNKVGKVYAQNFIHVINLYLLSESANSQKGQEFIQKQIKDIETQLPSVSDPVKKKQLEDKLSQLKSKVADHSIDTKESLVKDLSYGSINESATLTIESSLKGLVQVFSKQMGKEEAKKGLSSLKTTLKEAVNPQIVKIYEQIRNQEGLKTKIDENVNQLLNDTKGIASSILSLYKLLKPKSGVVDNPNLSPEIKKELGLFFSTMKPCLALDLYMVEETESPKENQESKENENLLLRYNNFVRLVKEEVTMTSGQNYFQNQGNQTGNQQSGNQNQPNQTGNQNQGNQQSGGSSTVSNAANNSSKDDKKLTLKEFADNLRDWWNKNMDVDQYIFSKSDAEKAKEQLDKKLAAKKDSIVIDGMDPVLEIVKCFNRAYKLHTTQVIPSGRTGGAVTNKIFMEYTCFGSGSPANAGEGGGPYRNNKLFDMWESNVMDILREKKYQKIFNVGTRLKVGNDYIEKAGSNLRKFMTDMLTGDEMYGKGGDSKGGLQAQFLDKYFGYKDGDDAKNTHYEAESERQLNQNNTPEPTRLITKEGTDTIEEHPKDPKELVGTFFALSMSGEFEGYSQSSPVKFYFYIHSVDSQFYYVSFSQTSYYIKNYLISGNTGRTAKMDDTDFKINTEQGDNGHYLIFATRIPVNKLYGGEGSFNIPSGNLEGSYIKHKYDLSDDNSIPADCNSGKDFVTIGKKPWKIERSYHIVDEGTGKRVKVASAVRVDTYIEKEGGFPRLRDGFPSEIGNVKFPY